LETWTIENIGKIEIVKFVQEVNEGVEDFQPLQDFRLPMLVFHQSSKKKKIFCTV
jgi:hypothetical protein